MIWSPSCSAARTRSARSCRSSAYAGSAATTRAAVSAAKPEPPAQQSSTDAADRSAAVSPNMARYSAADLDVMSKALLPAPRTLLQFTASRSGGKSGGGKQAEIRGASRRRSGGKWGFRSGRGGGASACVRRRAGGPGSPRRQRFARSWSALREYQGRERGLGAPPHAQCAAHWRPDSAVGALPLPSRPKVVELPALIARLIVNFRVSARVVLAGPDPDVPLVHEFDLPVDHLAPVLGVLVGSPVEIEVLRVDRPFVDELVLLGGEVLDPVVPLRVRAEPAERFDVDGPGHPG